MSVMIRSMYLSKSYDELYLYNL